MVRYVSLFSGIEAATVAWEPLGWEPMAFSEIDPFPCAVLAHRWPDVPNLGDITQIDWKEFVDEHGKPDVVVGGSPCQSFSIAGGREGLDGESRLMFEYIRAVQDIRPTWFLWENVPGVFSTDAGRAFGILLDAMEKLGYGLAWRVLDAQFFGLAQRRARVFLVGCLGNGGGAAAVLFNADSVSGNTQSSREKRKELTRASKERTGTGSTLTFDTTQITSKQNDNNPQFGDECHTLSRGDAPTVCIQGSMIGRDDKNGPQGQGLNDEVAFTLNTTDRHGVMCMADDNAHAAIDYDMSGTLKRGGGTPLIATEMTYAEHLSQETTRELATSTWKKES